MKYLKDLLAEAGNIKKEDLICPKDPVPEGYKVIGTLDLEQRRVYSLRILLEREINSEESIVVSDEHDDIRKKAIALNEKGQKLSILSSIIWADVRSAFNPDPFAKLGICEGWQIVEIPKKAVEDPDAALINDLAQLKYVRGTLMRVSVRAGE